MKQGKCGDGGGVRVLGAYLCVLIPSSEDELMDLFSVKFFVSLGSLLKWVKIRHRLQFLWSLKEKYTCLSRQVETRFPVASFLS